MKVKELIAELQKLNPEMPVCGQSETATWDIEAKDIIPDRNVYANRNDVYPEALILGYKH